MPNIQKWCKPPLRLPHESMFIGSSSYLNWDNLWSMKTHVCRSLVTLHAKEQWSLSPFHMIGLLLLSQFYKRENKVTEKLILASKRKSGLWCYTYFRHNVLPQNQSKALKNLPNHGALTSFGWSLPQPGINILPAGYFPVFIPCPFWILQPCKCMSWQHTQHISLSSAITFCLVPAITSIPQATQTYLLINFWQIK